MKRYISEIYVDNLELLGRRRDGDGDMSVPSSSYAAAAGSGSSVQPVVPMQDNLAEEDDLPF